MFQVWNILFFCISKDAMECMGYMGIVGFWYMSIWV